MNIHLPTMGDGSMVECNCRSREFSAACSRQQQLLGAEILWYYTVRVLRLYCRDS